VIPLFLLRNIASVNFYLYNQDFPITGRGNAVFLGGNGSGKSVLLDAIQIVMTGMNRRYLDLNSRVSEGGKSTRTVREACLGLLDDGQGFERDGCVTYIALGFETEDGARRCTAGVCLEAKASVGEENVLGLFISDGVTLRFDDFVHKDKDGFKEKIWQNFLDEQRRAGRIVQTFSRQNGRAFLRELHAIINGNARGTQLDPDRARAAMRQALSFDIEEIKSVTDFVKRFLLDEIPIEVETFQARYTTWREMQQQIARVEAEIKTVESIRLLTERVMDDQFNARFWSYSMHRAEYDRYSEIIERQSSEIEGMRNDLEGTQAYQDRLNESIESSRLLLDSVKRQIKGIPAVEEIEEAQAEKDRQDAVRNAGNIEAKPIFDALNALREAGESSSFPSSGFPEVAEFARTKLTLAKIGAYDATWPHSASQIAEIVRSVPVLTDAGKHVDSLHQHAASEKAQLAQELESIDRSLQNLHSGGTFLSSHTQDFLRDLGKLAIPAQTLCEVANIAPAFAEWRGIIESVLGDWAEAVIVEPKHMNQAYSHFDNNYKTSKAKLIQTENVREQDLGHRSGTLAEAVITDNRFARAFLNVRLGRIMRARSANDIRKGDLAASADGKYAHGRGIEYRRLQTIPRLGKSVRDQQIALLGQQQKKLHPLLDRARENESKFLSVIGALRRAETLLVTNRADTLAKLSKIENADLESRRQAELISDLEVQLPEGVMQQRRDLERDLQACKQELVDERKKETELVDKIGRRVGAMETNTETRKKAGDLCRDSFPALERRKRRHNPAVGLENFAQRAKAGYLNARVTQDHSALVRTRFENLAKEKRLSQRNTVSRLITAVQEYVLGNPDQHPGFEWTQFIESEQTSILYDWISLRHQHLRETVLRNFKVQVDKAVVALVEAMVHDFLSRLRGNIDAVERIKEDLNRALRGSVFMGEVYQIRYERDQDKETIRYLIDRLDIIAPKATALMQSELDLNDLDQVKIKELIDMLTFEASEDAAHRRRLQEIADYRNYFRFTIDICDPEQGNKKISDLEQRRGKASGGQKIRSFLHLPRRCFGLRVSQSSRRQQRRTSPVSPSAHG